jgi:protein YIPF6
MSKNRIEKKKKKLGNMENNNPDLPENTLDEPVYMTMVCYHLFLSLSLYLANVFLPVKKWRDLKMIGIKTFHVLLPTGRGPKILHDWDLWGPLVYCFVFATLLAVASSSEQHGIVFLGIFTIIWLGAGFITVNAKLLKSKCSFWQSLSVIGYCIFPMLAGAIMVLFWDNIIYRLCIVLVSLLWCTWATVGFFGGMALPSRRILVVYPVLLFYMILGWLLLVAPDK